MPYVQVIQGPEAVEQAVANTLTTNFNAALDAVYAAWAPVDSAPPEVYPAGIHVGGRDLIPSYPAIEVMATGGRMTEDGATVWGGFQHELLIVAWLTGDDKDTLNRQCLRYAWAIWKVLMAFQTLDGSLSGQAGVEPLEYQVSQPASKPTNQLLQAVGWRVTVNVEESV